MYFTIASKSIVSKKLMIFSLEKAQLKCILCAQGHSSVKDLLFEGKQCAFQKPRHPTSCHCRGRSYGCPCYLPAFMHRADEVSRERWPEAHRSEQKYERKAVEEMTRFFFHYKELLFPRLCLNLGYLVLYLESDLP